MRNHLLAGLLVAVIGCARAPVVERQTEAPACIGPSNAQFYAVYFHGLESEQPGTQELKNRDVLAQVGASRSVRFALPRAQQKCGESRCWGWTWNEAERTAAAAQAQAAAKTCFPDGATYGLVGFSNGGYLLTNLLRQCELQGRLPSSQWAIAVGSAKLKGALEHTPMTLAGCGELTFLTGTNDIHNGDAQENYLLRLREKGASVSSMSFDGGHELLAEPLADALGKYTLVR